MEICEASSENAGDGKKLLVEFAKEKHDIVRGFIKEKEIIQMIHKEEKDNLRAEFEQEKQWMLREFELEKQDLLQRYENQQVENMKHIQREKENAETRTAKDFKSKERLTETKYKEDRVKLTRRYEEIITEKNAEIQMLRRELLGNKLLEHDERFSETVVKRTVCEDELKSSRENFEFEKSELKRGFDREKAELLQNFVEQTEKMNATLEYEKRRMQEDHDKEIVFKLEITEKLMHEKADIERKRIIRQFERELAELQESFEKSFEEKMFEKQQVIDDLEKERDDLQIALKTERFSLARIYNREISLLTKPDSLSKEDLEVALIDEVAKVRQQNDETIKEMERRHQQKVAQLKKSQKPSRELEAKCRVENDKLKRKFKQDKETMEAQFRVEQLNLLKSFEFERNDLEHRHQQSMDEKELEIQQREDELHRTYEGKIDELKLKVEQQRQELEVSKQQLADVADQMEEFLSEKNRMQERLLKEGNRYEKLEQKLQNNRLEYEENLREKEKKYQMNIQKIREKAKREKDQLKEQLQREQERMEEEIQKLKVQREELQMSVEEITGDTTQYLLESSPVDISSKQGSTANNVPGRQQQTNEPETKEESAREVDGGDSKSQIRRIKQKLREVRENLNRCVFEEQQLAPKTLEDFQSLNKHLKVVFQQMKEIDSVCGEISIEPPEDEELSGIEQLPLTVKGHLQLMETIMNDDEIKGKIDKTTKQRVNKRIQEISMNVLRLHEFEKLKLKKEHQEELNQVLKELADEKRKEAQRTRETGHNQERESMDLKSNGEKEDSTKHDYGASISQSKVSEGKTTPKSDETIATELKRENEEIKRSIEELQKSFLKEKEEIMEKLHTQHKEFVMSSDEEIIEKLLKQRSALEEAFNLERFYLSRLYYLEMKEELEDILSTKKNQMKKEYDRDKMEIILKYESDIAEIHNILSEKDTMEVKLLRDRNEATKKLSGKQRKSASPKNKKSEKDQQEIERENLEVAIPLKEEIAELQKKRYKEHETAVANLKLAIDLIRDLMIDNEKNEPGGNPLSDHLLSEDPSLPTDKAEEGERKPRLLMSEDEIRNRDELKDALENLVDVVINSEDETLYESETTSGASSDLESEDSSPTPVNEESDEGAYSGPESGDGDVVSIKKAQLDLAFNLERFNLSRVYYSEYKDSLKKALRKLAQTKDSLRNKRRQLENDMTDGIKQLVERTYFGNSFLKADTQECETQTILEMKAFDDRLSEISTEEIPFTDIQGGSNEVKPDNDDNADGKHLLDSAAEKAEYDRDEKEEHSRTDNLSPQQQQDITQMLPTQTHHTAEDRRNTLHIKEDENSPALQKKLDQVDESLSAEDKKNEPLANVEIVTAPDTKRAAVKFAGDESANTKSVGVNTYEDVPLAIGFQDSVKGPNEEERTDTNLPSSTLQTHDQEKDEGVTKIASGSPGEETVLTEKHVPNLENKEKDIAEEKIVGYAHDKDDAQGKEGLQTKDESEAANLIESEEKKDTEKEYLPPSLTVLKKETEKREDKEGAGLAEGDEKPPNQQTKSYNNTEAEAEPTKESGEVCEGGNKVEERNSIEQKEGRVSPPTTNHEVLGKGTKEGGNISSEPVFSASGKKGAANSEPVSAQKMANEDHKDVSTMNSHEDDQDLIRELQANNRALLDKFSLLCELVGRRFVNEIPELKEEQDPAKQATDDGDLISIQNLEQLLAEREQIADKIEQIDSQINDLAMMKNSSFKDLSNHLDEEELRLLQSVEDIDRKIKRHDEKDLVEHLLKEKEEVCKKLDEINNQLKDEQETFRELAIKDSQKIAGLMCKLDALKDEGKEKARQLYHKSKMLENSEKSVEKEKERVKDSEDILHRQLSALNRALENGNTEENPVYRIHETEKGLAGDVLSVLERKAQVEKEAAKLEKYMTSTKREIKQYEKILEEQKERLLPFQRKKARLEKFLSRVDSRATNDGGNSRTEQEDIDIPGYKEETADPLKQQNITARQNNLDQLYLKINGPHLSRDFQGLSEDLTTEDQINKISKMKSAIQEQLKDLEGKLAEERLRLKAEGIADSIGLSRLLEDNKRMKQQLENLTSSHSFIKEETEEVIQGVDKLRNLLQETNAFQEFALDLDEEVSKEQQNFLDALKFHRDGTLQPESSTTIRELVAAKSKLAQDLQQANEEILHTISSGGLKGHQSDSLEQFVENKVKLENAIATLEDKIEEEPIRSAQKLTELLDKKFETEDDLDNTPKRLTEEVNSVKEVYNNNAPENVRELLCQANAVIESLTAVNLAQEEKKLIRELKELEKGIKGKAAGIAEAKLGLDTTEDQEILETAISEKLAKESRLKLIRHSHNQTRHTEQTPASETLTKIGDNEKLQRVQFIDNIDGEWRNLIERLRLNENQLEELTQSAVLTSDEIQRCVTDNMDLLVSKKVNLEGKMQELQNAEEFLQKRKELEEHINDRDVTFPEERQFNAEANFKYQLNALWELIQRRETDQQKNRGKLDDKHNLLDDLKTEKEFLQANMKDVERRINNVMNKLQSDFKELQKETDEHERYSFEEQKELGHAVEELKRELRRYENEQNEIQNDLDRHKYEKGSDIRLENALDLEKLLVEKESLRDYLDEIDGSLHQYQFQNTGEDTPVDIEELSKQRRQLKAKLSDLAVEKAKLDVEFEDDEMEEIKVGLMQQRKELEKRKEKISNQILAAGVVGKFAEKKGHNDDIPVQYIQDVLNKMQKHQKALIELIKDHEDLKNVSQRQRARLENRVNFLKAKVGEDLIAVIAADSNYETPLNNLDALARVQVGEDTVSGILSELWPENKDLRNINDELNLELELLKSKVGDALANELLGEGLSGSEPEFADVTSKVHKHKETLASILQKQQEDLEFMEDKFGKNLVHAVFENKGLNYRRPELIAPDIMKTYDEDLENVIAAYEKRLDDLLHENDVVKRKLGDSLFNALMQADSKLKPFLEDSAIQFTDSPFVRGTENNMDPTSPDSNIPDDDDKRLVLKTKVKKEPAISEVDSNKEDGVKYLLEMGHSPDREGFPKVDAPVDQLHGQDFAISDGITPQVQVTHPYRLQDPSESQTLPIKPCQPQGTKKLRLETLIFQFHPGAKEQSTRQKTIEKDGDLVEPLKAPRLMQKYNKTLGEIIAQYERDLDNVTEENEALYDSNEKQRESELSEDEEREQLMADVEGDMPAKDYHDHIHIPVKHDGISEVDSAIQNILDTQEKSLEMLRLLKERLGDDLVHALMEWTTATTDPETRDIDVTAIVGSHMGEQIDEMSPETTDQGMDEKKTNGQIIDGVEQLLSPDAGEANGDTSMVSKKTSRETSQSSANNKGNTRRLKAPVIARESKKTLADVIASYENGLNTLESKIGPTLTRKLIDMEEEWNPKERKNIELEMENREKDELSKPDNVKTSEAPEVFGEDEMQEAENGDKTDNRASFDASAYGAEPFEMAETTVLSDKLRAPDIMATEGKTLEEVIKVYEDSINEELKYLDDEIKLLREKLGNRLFNTLVTKNEDRDENRKDLRGDPGEVDIGGYQRGGESTKDVGVPETSDKDNEKPFTTEEKLPDNLRAKALIKDKGRTVEDILKTYEKELEALARLVPGETRNGNSILDLVSDYEEKLKGLERKNEALGNRLKKLEKMMGPTLTKALEHEPWKGDEITVYETEEITLHAPAVMQAEETTLENVLRNYEKELDTLRKIVSDDGGFGSVVEQDSISDIKDYEDKIQDLNQENKNLKLGMEKLRKTIGPKLSEDLEKLACTELDMDVDESSQIDGLNAPILMDEKQWPLEKVVAMYEENLDDVHKDLQALTNGLGEDLAKYLLSMESEKQIMSPKDEYTRESVESTADKLPNNISADKATGSSLNVADAEESCKGLNQTLLKETNDSPINKTYPLGDLKAKDLMIDEGKTIEGILRSYERDLEALSKLIPNETPTSLTIPELLHEYEEKIGDLDQKNSDLKQRLQKLAETLGPGLTMDLQSIESNETDDRDDSLHALGIMQNEDKTLENVIKGYEKELDLLRKMNVDEDSEKGSLSQIMKDYEDKIEDLHKEKQGLKDYLNEFEKRIGPKLVQHLKKLNEEMPDERLVFKVATSGGECNNTSSRKAFKAPNIMVNDKMTLEQVVAFYEENIEDLKGDIHILKDGVGEALADWMLDTAKERALVGNSGFEDQKRQAVFVDASEPKTTETTAKNMDDDLTKGNTREPRALERASEGTVQPLGTENDRDLPISSQFNDLKAKYLMKDDGRTIENILRNYEKELEALSKLVSAETGQEYSISDIVTNYEDKMKDLEKRNMALEKRLHDLAKNIGKDLTTEMESLQSRTENEASRDECIDHRHQGLKAPSIMRNEGRTLQNVLNKYENELDVLRNMIPGEDAASISDIVKGYENKVSDVEKERAKANEELNKLKMLIGFSLFEDLKKLDGQASKQSSVLHDKVDFQEREPQQELKVVKIMSNDTVSLEDVVRAYEKHLQDLEGEIAVLIGNIGENLAANMLVMGDIKEFKLQGESEIEKHPSFSTSDRDDDTPPGSDELKAYDLMRNEGRAVQDILKMYENELEALSQLISGETAEATSVPKLVSNYVDKINWLQKQNKNWEKRFDKLAEDIGEGLLNEVENLNNADVYGLEEAFELRVANAMKSENKSLENVVKNYEKELDALRLLVSAEGEGKNSISDIVKDSEEKLEKYDTEKGTLQKTISELKLTIGPSLFEDLTNLRKEFSEEEISSVLHSVQHTERLKVTKIMKENKTKLEDVVAKYEKDLGEMEEETKVLKDKLGHNLARRVLEMQDAKRPLSPKDSDEMSYKSPLTDKTQGVQVDEGFSTENLKAIALMENEDSNLENILENYEKELVALSELVQSESGEVSSISSLVRNYEDRVAELEKQKRQLDNRLDDLAKIIGPDLFNAMKNLLSGEKNEVDERTGREKEYDLNLPQVMRNEGRTLENVINNYETELDILRKVAAKDGENSIERVVKHYENKIGDLVTESAKLRSELDKLAKRIGSNLVEDLKNLDLEKGEADDDASVGQEEKKEIFREKKEQLTAPEIMNEKKLTLQEVVAAYEKNLHEAKALKEFLGEDLSAYLLLMADDNKFPVYPSEDHKRDSSSTRKTDAIKRNEPVEGMEAVFTDKQKGNVRIPAETMDQLRKGNKDEEVMGAASTLDELKATVLIRDEGRTVENILKNYEKELEALKTPLPGKEACSISDLVQNYEDKIDDLQAVNKIWEERFNNLDNVVGSDLLKSLESVKTTYAEAVEEKEKADLKAPVVMRGEGLNLEGVVRNYERELDVLRKRLPKEVGEQASTAEIFKDYDDKIDLLKEQNTMLQTHLNQLEKRIGYNLSRELKRLDGEVFADDEVLQTDKDADAGNSRELLQALDVMIKDELTLEELVLHYEGNTKNLEGELKALRDTIGNRLASWLLSVAKKKMFLTQDDLNDHKREAVFLDAEEPTTTSRAGSEQEDNSEKPLKQPSLKADSQSDDLKAKDLIKNNARTVEDVLISYEKQLEALASLVPSETEQGCSVPELVANYEDMIWNLENRNRNLEEKFDERAKHISSELLNERDNGSYDKKNSNENDKGCHLKSQDLMRTEQRTLQDEVKNYEKELDVLRELVLDDGDQQTSISNIVKQYEDLNEENERIRNTLARFEANMGANLFGELKMMDKVTSDVDKTAVVLNIEDTALNSVERCKKLKAPEIMVTKCISLESVIADYEQDITDIKQENAILQDTIGGTLASRLLQVANKASIDEIAVTSREVKKDNPEHVLEGKDDRSENSTGLLSPQLNTENLHRVAADTSACDVVKAIALIRDEGTTVENILKRYEGELEALRKLVSNEVDQGTSISDVVKGYEDKMANLEEEIQRLHGLQNENIEEDLETKAEKDVQDNKGGEGSQNRFYELRSMKETGRQVSEEMKYLKESIGKELVDELLNLNDPDGDKKNKWKATEKMKQENATLAKVLGNYEREIEKLEREKSAIESLVPENEGDGQSALDVISQYEDEVERLKDREQHLEDNISVIRDRIGDALVDDILNLSDAKTTRKTSIKALRIMAEKQEHLANVLKEYEDELSKLTHNSKSDSGSGDEKGFSEISLREDPADIERKYQEMEYNKNRVEEKLNTLSRRIGTDLAKEILITEIQNGTLSLDAVRTMEQDDMTLAEVVEQYENDIKRKDREMSTMKEIMSDNAKLTFLMDKISAYEDQIAGLKRRSKEQSLLEKKVGIDLANELLSWRGVARKKSQGSLTLNALDLMERNEDTTVEHILRGYEEELQTKNQENETLKQLVSGDVLGIAASQESEIDQLKKEKQILSSDLEFISDKLGKDLFNELLKRSRPKPSTESTDDFNLELVEQMESEGKPLVEIIKEYVNEIDKQRSDTEEGNTTREEMESIAEKIGNNLFKEILNMDKGDTTHRTFAPRFEVLTLMSEQDKPLEVVIQENETELARLRRENSALQAASSKDAGQKGSVIESVYAYEDKIEKLTTDNKALTKKVDKLSKKLGEDLSEALLDLPEGGTSRGSPPSVRPVSELKALKTVAADQSTLADVLRTYEQKIQRFEDIDLGPSASSLINKDDIKLAKLIQVKDKETKSRILAEESKHQEETADKETFSDKSPFDVADEMKRLTKENDILLQLEMGNSVESESVQDVLSDYKREIQKLKNANNTLSNRLECLSRRVGVALSRELSKSPEEGAMESVPTSSKAIWKPETFRDVTEDMKTIEEVLHEYQEKLKTMLQAKQFGDDGSQYDNNAANVEEIVAEVLREQESEPLMVSQLEPQLHSDSAPVEEFICGFKESDAVNLYEVSPQIRGEDDTETAKEVREELKPEDIANLNEYLMSLGDLITAELQKSLYAEQEPQHIKRDQENTEEVIVKVEAPPPEEHFNTEYLETLFGEDFSLVEAETDHCEAPDTDFTKSLTENETEQEDRLINEPMTMFEGLSLVENDTTVTQDDQSKKESFEQKFRDFEKQLEEERKMKEKYEKDVQDLLNDIVEIKMKQAQDVDDDPELMRKKMKEEIELKQNNKRLQDDLSQERKRRMSLEESKRDLLDEVDRLMKDKETFQNEKENSKNNEKALQEMMNQRKTIGEFNKINRQLKKENGELKEALKNTENENKNKKEQLMAEFEEEKKAMRKESMTGKAELEIQLQELLVMNDDLKRNIKDLQEELNGAYLETHEERRHQDEKKTDTTRNSQDGDMDLMRKTQENLQQTLREKEESLEKERSKNESLKDQLNDAEDAITKYQREIDCLETEKAKTENELRQENSILTNKLEMEKAATEQQRKDFEEILRREKDHLKEDIRAENERNRRRMYNDIEDRMEDLKRQEKKYALDMQELEKQCSKEKNEMTQIYIQEKKKLKAAFDEELEEKLKESNMKFNVQIDKMRDEFEREKNEMTRQLDTEKLEIQASIERKIYEQLLSKNISVENDFREALASILREQTKEIEGVESEIRDAEERFQQDKLKLVEQSNSEKEKLNKNHQKEKQALESTIQNLLKEVVKLKHQRKEMRAVHKKEKENMEEIFERERMQLKEEWERYKKELLDKLQEDFDNKLANEAVKFEASLDELKQQLVASEKRRGELQERLREITLEKEHNKLSAKEKGDKTGKQREAELKQMKKSMEVEYEKKLKEEKRKFEETLQALRREIGSLQEKRRLIQDKVYNQDSSMVDRHVIEKSIANYKKEFLLKMEEQMTERITRERKPLEETINELEREIEELKRQRWELRNQLRRERAKLEEEFELERERMESTFLKEREELKTRLEVTIQKEMMKRSMDEKANRTLSPVSNETLYSPQTSPRRLRSENTSLREDNDRLASEVERLTSKLDTLESNFQGIISSEKIKAERMKQIQAKIPKKVTFSDEIEARRMDYSTSGEQNEQLLQALKQRESQVTQLVEAKRFYEEMISELCEEAGLFELDQNVSV